ncbi:MAG TPA: hypothetical protein VMT26_04725 [Candidatus Bathyarchaeia archaeon]|jgi:hypothetical protein|nr:hypothetical protein [Candidatus Bathyarchaeia archaeon]
MSKQVKKTVSSTSFSINKLYRRLTARRPSTLILAIIGISLAIFLFGGGLYDIINQPLPAVYVNGRFVLIYPALSEQFVADSVISMILYAFGIIGLVAIYQSTKYAYKPRQAYLMLIVGATFVMIAYAFLVVIIQSKLSGSY